jgi:hypothetical protein
MKEKSFYPQVPLFCAMYLAKTFAIGLMSGTDAIPTNWQVLYSLATQHYSMQF